MTYYMKQNNYIRVEGNSNLSREESSGAIVNTDIQSYKLAIKRKETYQKQREEINSLKSEMKEMKTLMVQLIEKLNG